MRQSDSTYEWRLVSVANEESDGIEYWSETRRPLVCLVFLAPLLAIYECGVRYYGGQQPDSIRNGADSWMRCWLALGVGNVVDWLLPCLLVGGLLAWHIASRQSWKVGFDTPLGMLAESLLFAIVLLLVGQATDQIFRRLDVPTTLSTGAAPWQATAVTFVGAGIYEELMFRLCLLPCCFAVLRLMRLSAPRAMVVAVLTTSLAFSLAHYIGPAAETFDLFTFTFRTIAGMFFAVLFVKRGFGIAVGCHATYDLLVGVLLGN